MGTIPIEGKTVAIAVAIAAVLSAAGGGGSAAFFADTAASQDNSITAADWTEDVGVRVSPNPIEAGSQGNSVQVKIEQPNDGEIDPDTVEVELASDSFADDPQTSNPKWSIHTLDRQAVIDAVDGEPGSYTLTVSGDLEGGGTFEGSTEVTVKADSGDDSHATTDTKRTNRTAEGGNESVDNATGQIGNETADNVTSQTGNETVENTTNQTGNRTTDSDENTTQAGNTTATRQNVTSGENSSSGPGGEAVSGNETMDDSVAGNSSAPDGEGGNETGEEPPDPEGDDTESDQDDSSEDESDDSTDDTGSDAGSDSDSGDEEQDSDDEDGAG